MTRNTILACRYTQTVHWCISIQTYRSPHESLQNLLSNKNGFRYKLNKRSKFRIPKWVQQVSSGTNLLVFLNGADVEYFRDGLTFPAGINLLQSCVVLLQNIERLYKLYLKFDVTRRLRVYTLHWYDLPQLCQKLQKFAWPVRNERMRNSSVSGTLRNFQDVT